MNLNRNALLKRAVTSFQKGDLFNSRAICQEILAKHPSDVGAMEILARTEFEDQNLDIALGLQTRLVASSPRSVHFRLILGAMLTRMARFEDAILEIEKAFREQPGNVDAAIALIDALEKSGDKDGALQVLGAIQDCKNPTSDLVVLRAKLATTHGHPEEAVALVEELARSGPLNSAALFTLGKAYEKLRDGDRAFDAYRRAKQFNKPPFDRAKFVSQIDDIIRMFTPDRARKLTRGTLISETPIFVAARPRSGTTLLSRIIGSHPQGFDSGENGILLRIVRNISLTVGSTLGYPEIVADFDSADADMLGQAYLDAARGLGGNADRIADKSLTNHLYLGLVQCVLPRSRAIWCRRDAVDNCLACFSEDFGWKHPYTHDLVDLGVTHKAVDRLMRHWQEVLDLQILELNYEELVSDQEGQTRRLLAFCGLPWDERCLRFYETGSAKRSGAQTLSYQQVRKPMYSTSVGRARLFETHLGPLIDALKS